ncbi:assimilatory sulfite reductase (NADPH) flavoprotein subunit [Thiobaca trueperi]|uniref:Sulfite reductase [NADPH] flavoprotein alpha-component n=1 Tax=Thiobaca trueperi TaxID=127458 RepID=A0A4R3N4P4_9GAMM|nr:assimilatory sulfite reductase (NADPH) flavoprotein subunit [Thiobaca trueperi]TCT24148.1 sulfite reductase (NADPH) alpha subunit [Thiobaca trueperi]
MALSQLTPLTSPLDERQLTALQTALTGLSPLQIAWVSGYLAGRGAVESIPASVQASAPASGLTILYGSQTGNTRGVAESLAARLHGRGIEPRLLSLGDYKSRDIASERLLLLLVSTHGEGEPPESAQDLFKYLHGKRAPRLESLRYAVLGLGDSSYAQFCQAARAFDVRLRELGAHPLLDLQCGDVDYRETVADWSGRVLELTAGLVESHRAKVIPIHGGKGGEPVAAKSAASGPLVAELIERRRLTTADAVGEVHHLVLAIDPERLRFTPGDALGVWFRNDPVLVDAILTRLQLDGDSPVTLENCDLALREALSEHLDLTQLHPNVVKAWAERSGSDALADLSADGARLRDYAGSRQFVDLITEHPGRLEPSALVGLLQPLRPRLYSIASSQTEIPDEVHLTVSLLRYAVDGRERLGGASGFLARRLREDEPIQIAITENPGFRLPADDDTPLILIGAGTGIAPFRAFLQERAARGARGRHWLIFGNRHYRRDFLYQLDWQAHRKAGRLEQVSVAFSRDQGDKRYVQHRLREQGRDLHAWLQDGAHLYVCGATAMGRAVHEALLDVIAHERGIDHESADDTLNTLRQDGRYQRDLY